MTIGKTTKKLTFRHFMLKRLAAALAIGLALGCVIFGLAYNLAALNASSQDMYEFSAVQQAILKNQFTNGNTRALEYYSTIYSDLLVGEYTGLEKALVITEKDTGRVVATSEFAAFAILREEGSESAAVYMCCDRAVVDYLMQYRGTEHTTEYGDIYIKGDSFMPSTITISTFKNEEQAMMDGAEARLAETRDFTPSDTEGYERYGGNKLTIAVGSRPDSGLMAEVLSAVEGKSYDDAANALNNVYLTGGNVDFVNFDSFALGGTEYAIYSLAVFDFWRLLGVPALAAFIVLAALCVAAAWISAYVSYTKYSAAYESDEYRRSLIDALSHDLKTPLMAISGYTENLKSGAHPEKSEYYTDAILDNTRYMNDTIASVLQLSRLEEGCVLTREPLDAAAIARELFEKYRPAAEERGIACTVSGACTLSADKKLLSQAMENLIANAVKYTSDGGSITITAAESSLEVRNTCDGSLSLGMGELCRPLSKGDSSRAKNSGTGMGLSIVKRICELHRFRFEAGAGGGSFTAAIRF